MFAIIGLLVVLGCVAGGYVMGHGNLSVLWQPAEFIIILGAAMDAKSHAAERCHFGHKRQPVVLAFAIERGKYLLKVANGNELPASIFRVLHLFVAGSEVWIPLFELPKKYTLAIRHSRQENWLGLSQ